MQRVHWPTWVERRARRTRVAVRSRHERAERRVSHAPNVAIVAIAALLLALGVRVLGNAVFLGLFLLAAIG